MTGTIRKHQGWLWVVIAVVIVVSFLGWGPNTSSRMGDLFGLRRQSTGLGMLAGKPIDRKEYTDAMREVNLGYFLMRGVWPEDKKQSDFNATRETYNALLEDQKAREYGIEVSPETAAKYAREILGPLTYDTLVEKILKPKNLTIEDFERFVRHQIALQQLTAIAGLTGRLVTPQEAEHYFRKEYEEVSASVVFFSATNYFAGVTASPDAIARYYSNAQANYSIPVRRVMEFVVWPASNYLAEAKSQMTTNLDAIVESNYKQGTNFYKDSKTAEEAKTRVREDALHGQAMYLAKMAAAAFATELDNKPKALASLAELAKAKSLAVGTTEPFDQDSGPRGIDATPKFLQAAFSRTAEEPFSGAVEGGEGFYVLGFKAQIDSSIPPLKDVESRVMADYKQFQAAQTARQIGSAFATTVTNGLVAGKKFAELVATAGVKAETLPPFSLSTRGELPLEFERHASSSVLRQVGFMVEPGQASPFIPTAEGGFVLYTAAKIPVSAEKLQKELPAFMASMRQLRQNDAVNQWFQKQIEADPAFMQTLQSAISGMQPGARPGKANKS